jgi:hypothetical protein
MFPSPRRTPLVQQDYIWPVRVSNEFDKLKKIRVTEGYDECLIMAVQRQSFRKLINSVSIYFYDNSLGSICEGELN